VRKYTLSIVEIPPKRFPVNKTSDLIRRVASLLRNPVATRLLFFAVAAAGIFYRLIGFGRSLWIDEAWVANSVAAGSLSEMFRYDAWLQTSPPAFLALVRITVQALGLSNPVLRLIPLVFGLLSAVLMFILARRVLAPRFARPAWAIFVLSPLGILFSKTLKQFSAETAVAAALLLMGVLYLERRTALRFGLLLAVVTVGPLLAYSIAFSLPGTILLVFLADPQRRRGFRRALILSLVSGGVFVALYLLCIAPNSSPSLRSYWANDHAGWGHLAIALADAHSLLYQLPVPRPVLDSAPVAIAAGILFLTGLILACVSFRRRRHKWLRLEALCGFPCLLLLVCSNLSLYPVNERMSLFLLPAVVLLGLMGLQLIVEFLQLRMRRVVLMPVADILLVCVTLLAISGSILKQPLAAQNIPLEDMESAMRFLRADVHAGDLVWVHASVSEDFKLYRRMAGWNGPPVQFGNTGWPCCPRGIAAVKGTGREADVRNDIDRAIPMNFRGRVWLVYTTRPEHWEFVGIDESRILNDLFRERGCRRVPAPFFHGIGVGIFDCESIK
jgi:hypothetical protein